MTEERINVYQAVGNAVQRIIRGEEHVSVAAYKLHAKYGLGRRAFRDIVCELALREIRKELEQ